MSDEPETLTTERDPELLPRGFGIDVGGSGIKAGIVDMATGQLIGERLKLPTPQPSTPEAVAETVAEVVRHFEWSGPIGVTYPGVVVHGTARTAANVDRRWIGADAAAVFGAELDGQPVTVLNDADAAGLAEVEFGAGRDTDGVIVLLTFGTGIGSAVIHQGILLPNTEFGRIDVGGREAELRAASSVKDRKRWGFARWSAEVTQVLVAFENAFWPDLFIAGGGISGKAHKWIPRLENRTPVTAAELRNTAGIVGAALASCKPDNR